MTINILTESSLKSPLVVFCVLFVKALKSTRSHWKRIVTYFKRVRISRGIHMMVDNLDDVLGLDFPDSFALIPCRCKRSNLWEH